MGHGLPHVVQGLLFQQGIAYLSRLAGKIKIPSNALPCNGLAAAKSVIVEGVSRLIQVPAEAIVGVIKIERLALVALISAQAGKRVMSIKHAARAGLGRPVSRQGGIEAEEGHSGGRLGSLGNRRCC